MEAKLEVLLLFHILAAVFWVGGGLMMNIAMPLAARSGDPAAMLATMRLARTAGIYVFIPSALVILATGIWMVSDYYAWDLYWVNYGLGGAAVALGIVAFYLLPRANRAIAGLEAKQPPPPGRNWVPIVARFNFLLLLSVVVVMVVKPT